MKIRRIVFITLLLFPLISCTNSPFAFSDRNYVSIDVTYSEPTAQYAFRLNMDSAETDFAKYFFEPCIEKKERNSCMKTTDLLLAGQSFGDVIPEIYIFSPERYDYTYISNHKLYSSVRDWKSAAYITDVLLTVHGESAHYGTAFGYANYLAGNQKWDCYRGKYANPSVKDILDLNYLCFDEKFAAAADVEAARGIACAFIDSYIGQYSEQALQQLLSSPSESINALAAYYAENGVTYAPSAIQYGHGGRSCDYLVYTDYGTFYIAKDWVDIHAELNPLITDGFLHSNYAETKAFFETNLRQMKQYQDLFQLNDYNNDLDIVFTPPIAVSQTSFYQSLNHRIYVYNVDSLMHEFIHSLTLTKPNVSMSSWQVEGFARYFSYYYDFYGIAFLNQDYNNTPDTPALQYIHEYRASINRPIDMAKDYAELENIAVFSRSWTNPDENYLTGSSFVQYLVKQYGEEAVTQSIYGSGNSLPESYAELVKGWNEHIKTHYNSYSKYK